VTRVHIRAPSSTSNTKSHRPEYHSQIAVRHAWELIVRLYEAGIDVGWESDFGNELKVWMVERDATVNRQARAQRTFSRADLSDLSRWLDAEARRLFPDSEYAKGPAFGSGPRA
jgi:hypothetical protein